MILLGKRYGGIEAKANGIVDKALPASQLLAEALKFAESLSKKVDRSGVYKEMRNSLFSSAIQTLQKSKL
jgi:enoyl-CoA hydratase/carnithine racemase